MSERGPILSPAEAAAIFAPFALEDHPAPRCPVEMPDEDEDEREPIEFDRMGSHPEELAFLDGLSGAPEDWASEDFATIGASIAGEPWLEVPAADLAAMAHAVSRAPLVLFDADPFGEPVERDPAMLPPELEPAAVMARAVVESPIERSLLAALLEFHAGYLKPAERPALCRIEDWTLTTQRQAGRWRLDLALESRYGALCVEADGHDFHERTPEQAERDRRRDRTLTAAGWVVLRFTGREIWRSADGCALEIAEHMTKLERKGRS